MGFLDGLLEYLFDSVGFNVVAGGQASRRFGLAGDWYLLNEVVQDFGFHTTLSSRIEEFGGFWAE